MPLAELARAGATLTVASPLAIEGVEKIPPRFPPALGEPEVLLGAAVVVQAK